MSERTRGHEWREAVSPLKMLIIMVLLGGMTAATGFGGFLVTPRGKRPRRKVEGRLIEASVLESRSTRKGVTHRKYMMALKVEGEDLDLVLDETLFVNLLGGSIPAELVPDVNVVAEVEREPRKPLERAPFLAIVTLRTDAGDIVTLAQASADGESNQRIARGMFLAALLATLGMGTVGYRYYWGPDADLYAPR